MSTKKALLIVSLIQLEVSNYNKLPLVQVPVPAIVVTRVTKFVIICPPIRWGKNKFYINSLSFFTVLSHWTWILQHMLTCLLCFNFLLGNRRLVHLCSHPNILLCTLWSVMSVGTQSVLSWELSNWRWPVVGDGLVAMSGNSWVALIRQHWQRNSFTGCRVTQRSWLDSIGIGLNA